MSENGLDVILGSPTIRSGKRHTRERVAVPPNSDMRGVERGLAWRLGWKPQKAKKWRRVLLGKELIRQVRPASGRRAAVYVADEAIPPAGALSPVNLEAFDESKTRTIIPVALDEDTTVSVYGTTKQVEAVELWLAKADEPALDGCRGLAEAAEHRTPQTPFVAAEQLLDGPLYGFGPTSDDTDYPDFLEVARRPPAGRPRRVDDDDFPDDIPF